MIKIFIDCNFTAFTVFKKYTFIVKNELIYTQHESEITILRFHSHAFSYEKR